MTTSPSHPAAPAEAPEPAPAAARMLGWDVTDQGRDAARRIAAGMDVWEAWFGKGSWYADRRRKGQAGAGKER
jgi:hypothetical protein